MLPLKTLGFLGGLILLGQLSPTDQSASKPSTLIAPADAYAVRRYANESNGGEDLWYFVHRPFPADDVVVDLSVEANQRGWQPLDCDPLNPRVRSSRIAGWDAYLDLSQAAPSFVHVWGAEWLDPAGLTLLQYRLSYRSAAGDGERDVPKLPRSDELLVSIQLVPLSEQEARGVGQCLP